MMQRRAWNWQKGDSARRKLYQGTLQKFVRNKQRWKTNLFIRDYRKWGEHHLREPDLSASTSSQSCE